MIPEPEKLTIDSSVGGNGDVWMRLVALYAAAALRPELAFEISVPSLFINLGTIVFGDRLKIVPAGQKDDKALVYTSLGMRSLIKGIAKGTKYIVPYQRTVVHDKKEKKIKDIINNKVFDFANLLGAVQLPDWKYIKCYQGYLDIISIKKISSLDYDVFLQQLQKDYCVIYERMNGAIPVSDQLTIPEDLHENIIIFPNGTARQFVPKWWAKENLSNAYYAFYVRDKDAIAFKENGLKVLYFFGEPGDIIKLSNSAKWAISTDSFPSHLLQYSSSKCTILLTEVLKSRIVSPFFKGKVVNAEAPCHPCLHLDRSNHPYCAAGHTECINWKIDKYTQNIISSFKS